MNANRPVWIGWDRPTPRHPWRAIVHAATEDEAFNKLLDAVIGGDKLILPAGVAPSASEHGKGVLVNIDSIAAVTVVADLRSPSMKP